MESFEGSRQEVVTAKFAEASYLKQAQLSNSILTELTSLV